MKIVTTNALEDTLFINDEGLGEESKTKPDFAQVAWCRRFLREETVMTEEINEQRTSYGLKHEVEKWASAKELYEHVHISNGAFIQAAKQEGFWVQDEMPLNAKFNLCLKRERSFRGAGPFFFWLMQFRHEGDEADMLEDASPQERRIRLAMDVWKDEDFPRAVQTENEIKKYGQTTPPMWEEALLSAWAEFSALENTAMIHSWRGDRNGNEEQAR